MAAGKQLYKYSQATKYFKIMYRGTLIEKPSFKM